MFVAQSSFTVANELTEEVRQAFRNRPHLVDRAPGFLGMEVLAPLDAPGTFVLITRWQDEASFRDWHQSHRFADSHQNVPRGLKLDPQKTRIEFYEHITS